MHFKSVFILCALYFLKSAWSIGLTTKHINDIKDLYRLYKKYNDNYNYDIPRTMKELYGIEDHKSILEYNSDVPDYINFKEFVLALACKSYVSYEDERKILTCFEVEFFLGVFIEYVENFNQDGGRLTFPQLPDLFKELKFDNAQTENLLKSNKDCYEDTKFDIEELLSLMLSTKPKGDGLNLEQIKMFVNLYDVHKTESGSIDPLAIQEIFKEFDMAATKHEPKLFFQSNRSAGKELMELIVVTAQRSRTLHTDEEVVFKTNDIMYILSEFIFYDKDKDSLLSKGECSIWMEKFAIDSPSDSEEDILTSENLPNELIDLNVTEKFVNSFDDYPNYVLTKYGTDDATKNFAELLEIMILYVYGKVINLGANSCGLGHYS